MRRPRFLLLGALTVALLPGSASAARANDAVITAEQRTGPRVVTLTISTPAFTVPTKVDVDLPTNYDADSHRRWPVTYVLAGTMNTYHSFNAVVAGVKLTESYPSIVVSPNGDSGYWSDWYNDGAFGPPMYETYVIDQLIPLIDHRFHTIANRSQRAVLGISMGGSGSIMFAAHRPDLFAAAASLSGAVDSNLPAHGAVLSASPEFQGGQPDAIYGPRATQEVRWHGHNPTDLANNLRGLDLQVRSANGIPNPGIGENPAGADGGSCVIEGGVYMASVDLHNTLDALQIPHLWHDYGPGCHTPPNFKRELADTFQVFTKVFARPPAPPSSFNYMSIKSAFDIWGWHVTTDPNRALEFIQLNSVSDNGLTLVGSGTTTVTTPPLFGGFRQVNLGNAGTASATPDVAGRIRFTVDLGSPHANQQYTPQARADGQDTAGYFKTRSVTFRPAGQIALAALPHARSCRRSSLTLRLRRPRGVTLRKATVYVNGRRVRTVTGRALRRAVTLRGLPSGRLRVRVVVVTSTRRKFIVKRTYRAC
jgi:S-formylglutathione hydrolase FrmB